MEKETVCRFSLAVMCDDYADKILTAIKQVDTQRIHSATDALSTTYRGERTHVLDALQAFFTHANDGKTHITLEASFTGDSVGADSIRPQS